MTLRFGIMTWALGLSAILLSTSCAVYPVSNRYESDESVYQRSPYQSPSSANRPEKRNPYRSTPSSSVQITIGTFYDRLAPHGNWVNYNNDWVWLPDRVGPYWRPYTLGSWVYTRAYGWMWSSNERFGWATYHYGRWGYARELGWYWVPGNQWAPAWVAWSYGNDDVAWAPLPPVRSGASFSISINIGLIPSYYWQAVPTRSFTSTRLSDNFIRDRSRVQRIVDRGERNTVKIENNIVINNVIPVEYVEQKTKTKVIVREIKVADNPESAALSDSSVTVFNADVESDKNAKPRTVKKKEEIQQERQLKGLSAQDKPAELPPEIKDPSTEEPRTEQTRETNRAERQNTPKLELRPEAKLESESQSEPARAKTPVDRASEKLDRQERREEIQERKQMRIEQPTLEPIPEPAAQRFEEPQIRQQNPIEQAPAVQDEKLDRPAKAQKKQRVDESPGQEDEPGAKSLKTRRPKKEIRPEN